MKKRIITLLETKSGHFYEVSDPELHEVVYLPSSTNILTCFPSPGLDIWRETTTPEEIKRKQEEGKIQGSKVHHAIDLEIMGQSININGITDKQIELIGKTEKKLVNYLKEPFTEREEEALIGAENFWNEFQPITIANEIMVFSLKFGFAGTLDWFGYLYDKKTKKYDLWIVDWKTSKSLDRSYDLQLASYWMALQESYHKKFPKIRLGILQLGKNKCNYSFKEVKDKAKAWKLFLKTKDIYDDIHPNNKPPVVERRQQFTLNKFSKKGKIIKLT